MLLFIKKNIKDVFWKSIVYTIIVSLIPYLLRLNSNILIILVFSWITGVIISIIWDIKAKSIPFSVLLHIIIFIISMNDGNKEKLSFFLYIYFEFIFILIFLLPIFINIFIGNLKKIKIEKTKGDK